MSIIKEDYPNTINLLETTHDTETKLHAGEFVKQTWATTQML
jgi:hypothetical protein